MKSRAPRVPGSSGFAYRTPRRCSRPRDAASRWWLRHSLAALDAALCERGSRLVLVRMLAKFVHRPWEASAQELHATGIAFGGNFRAPITNHAVAA